MTEKIKKPEPEKKASVKKGHTEAETDVKATTNPQGIPAGVEMPALSPEAGKPVAPAKRMVLKTLKRVAASPPPSPTLRKVTGTVTRRVVPKAPPPKPVPPPPPPAPEPVKPVVQKEVSAPAPAAAATPVAPAKPTTPAIPEPKKAAPSVSAAPAAKPAAAPAKPIEKPKKEAPKMEPTATYKMPTPPPVRPARTPTPKPVTSPAPAPAPMAPPSAPAPVAASAAAAVATETPGAAAPRTKIRIPEVLTVKDLANRMNVKAIDVIKKLLGLGTLVTINQQIDADTATLAADAFGMDVEVVPILQEQFTEEKEDAAKLKPRPPVVTIMGHVDHGKTSLLDAIRKTRVAEREAGGITQHIGAYKVSTPKGDVAFFDTPGHEAFTAMRARGAQVTDIVVLVVAADDGVMPQTIEAIDHARAASVPIIVAVNKVDLPTANPERIRRDLAAMNLTPEEWGGKTIFVDVSAKKGTNLDKLLEMIGLEAEILELKANPDREAQGVVAEARLDPRRGVTVTLLVQKGTLRVGDVVVAGTTYGKIRAMTDDRGERMAEAGPSTPVEVLGLNTVPQAGDRFSALSDEREARGLVERRQMVLNEEAVKRRHVTLETLHDHVADGKMRELKIILKADVQGSVQALRDSLERMSTGEIRLHVIHSGVGGINETDVTLADASDAVIIGFNVRADAKSEDIARRDNVDIRTYRIIYEAIADIRAAMEGLLEPETSQVRIGSAEVRQVFKMSKGGVIAGSFVLEGKITRGGKARLLRDNVVVWEGSIESLKRFKDDAREVEKGFECGIGLSNFQDMKPKDIIEVYTEETKARKLEQSQ